VVGVSSEDGATTLTLCADDATHFPVCVCERPSLSDLCADTSKKAGDEDHLQSWPAPVHAPCRSARWGAAAECSW
jgi:hypothetical protein